MLALCLGIFANTAEAQTKKKTTPTRTVKKRPSTHKTTNSKTKAKISPTLPQVDTVAVAAVPAVFPRHLYPAQTLPA